MDTNMLQLYAVTDSQWLKEGQTLAEAVEAAIKGGVTMVQLREKHLDDEAFIALAKDVKKVTDAYHIPFLINDNINVCQACDADG
ncbi:thiamine phosphate synthase, partial [Frisingicoccus sp.]